MVIHSLKDVFNINPEGNYDNFCVNFEFLLDRFNHGNLVPEEWLYRKYKHYVDVWQVKYGDRDPKYIPRKEMLMSPLEFLDNAGYLKEYNIPKTSRDYYFFGDMSDADYVAKHEEFTEITKCKL